MTLDNKETTPHAVCGQGHSLVLIHFNSVLACTELIMQYCLVPNPILITKEDISLVSPEPVISLAGNTAVIVGICTIGLFHL